MKTVIILIRSDTKRFQRADYTKDLYSRAGVTINKRAGMQSGNVRALILNSRVVVSADFRQYKSTGNGWMNRREGNAYFKEGKYDAAVDCYSLGMEADVTNVLLPANRAMAYLKLERFAEAEEDCSKAISLDGTYSKAFARRATARVALGKLSEAKEDFEQVLKLEPGNKQAANEISKITMDLNAGRTSTGADGQRRVIQPINKPPHLRSTKPLRRLEIDEIKGDLPPTEGSLDAAGGASASLVSAISPQPLLSARAGPSDSKAEGPGSAAFSSPSAKIQKIEELPDVASQPPAKGPEGDRVEVEKTKAPVKKSPDGASGQASSSQQESHVPPPPPNSFQLEADLRKIGKRPELIYKYLKQIEPEAYSRIFQNSLEPDILNQILGTLQNFYIKNEKPELILDILKNLASVRRFDMTVMFMSSKEKKVIQDLFEAVRQAGINDVSVLDLKKKYGV